MKEIKLFVREKTPFPYINIFGYDFGWGNGYVALPKEHPCYGMDYDKINVDIHGGLTFGEYADDLYTEHIDIPSGLKGMYIVGFDTFRLGDGELFPTKKEVLKETKRLKKQLENISKIETKK